MVIYKTVEQNFITDSIGCFYDIQFQDNGTLNLIIFKLLHHNKYN